MEVGDEAVGFTPADEAPDKVDTQTHGVVTAIDGDTVSIKEVYATSIWGNSQARAGDVFKFPRERVTEEKLAHWAKKKLERR